MTRKEALEILDRASSSVATNRQTHQQIINAVQIIYSAIEKLEELELSKKENG
jgi:hypothetical protein